MRQHHLLRAPWAGSGLRSSSFAIANNLKIREQAACADRGVDMTKLMSKSELIQKIAEQHPNKLTRDDIKGVLDALVDIGHAELKKTGAFLVHGFAKFVVVEKPATEAHEGINPFTKEPMTFEAKPASKVIKARPVQAAKDAVAEH
jgi:DNA-binding protein HU-beta